MLRASYPVLNPAEIDTSLANMKSIVCLLTLAVLVAVASAGYLSSGWSSPYYSGYSSPVYSRISYAPSYGGYSGYGGGYSGYSGGYGGYGGHGGNSGWW